MRSVLPILCCAGVLCGQGTGTGSGSPQTPPTQTPPTQTQSGKPGQKPGDKPSEGHVVPDAIGFRNRGLITPEGHPVPGGDGKMTDLQRGREREGQDAGPVATAGVMNGDHMFTATALIQPRRLAPGESGSLHVLVLLTQPRMVALPGSRIELKLESESGALDCGESVLQPAPVARAAKKFAGAPVYEETLIFKVPVEVKTDATFGEHAVPGTVILDLFDGHSGDPQGTFAVKVSGKIAIGKPLPQGQPAQDKPAQGKPTQGEPETSAMTAPDGVPAEVPARTPSTAASSEAGTAGDARREPTGDPAVDGDPGDDPGASSTPGGRPSIVLYLGMGLCVCTLLVLLLISRRE